MCRLENGSFCGAEGALGSICPEIGNVCLAGVREILAAGCAGVRHLFCIPAAFARLAVLFGQRSFESAGVTNIPASHVPREKLVHSTRLSPGFPSSVAKGATLGWGTRLRNLE